MKYPTVFVDFIGGSHGNFLEYCINRFIFNNDTQGELLSMFTESGASHAHSEKYDNSKEVVSCHLSQDIFEYNTKPPYTVSIPAGSDDKKELNPNTKIIQIGLPYNKREQIISTCNLLLRAGNVEKYYYNDKISGLSTNDARNILKGSMHSSTNAFKLFKHTNQYNFQLQSFYEIDLFIQELNNVSVFLGRYFDASIDLFVLWKEFITLNSGYQIYNKIKELFEMLYLDKNMALELTLLEEAALCFYIENTFMLSESGLNDIGVFPSSIYELRQIIDSKRLMFKTFYTLKN